MSTRCRIGRMISDNEIHSIYVHSDGYLDWTGESLLKNWNSEDKVESLIKLGDASLVTPDYESQKNQVYGTKEFPYKIHNSFEDFLHFEQEYTYLWDNNWYLIKDGAKLLLKDLI